MARSKLYIARTLGCNPDLYTRSLSKRLERRSISQQQTSLARCAGPPQVHVSLHALACPTRCYASELAFAIRLRVAGHACTPVRPEDLQTTLGDLQHPHLETPC